MNDQTTQPEAEAADANAKKPTVELVKDRRTFPNLEEAGKALAGIAEQSSDFDTITWATPGAKFEDGEFIPEADEWTAETHEIMLAPLATKTVKDKDGNITKPARLIALVLCPIPTVAACMEDDTGLETVLDVWRKEMNHRAVRKLRGAENVEAATTEMPLSLESFVTSQAGGGATGLVAFDDHWLVYSQAMAKKVPAWAARFPGGKGKAHIRAAIENAARAKTLFPELEAYGKTGTSLFVRLLQGCIAAAEEAGQDVTLLKAWMDSRDKQTFDAADATKDVDLDDLFDDLDVDSDSEDDDPPTVEDGELDDDAPETEPAE